MQMTLMWFTKLLDLIPEGRAAAEKHFQEGSEDPTGHASHSSKWARMGAAQAADQALAASLVHDDDADVRIAARDRLAKLRWTTPEKVRAERIRNHD